MNGKDNLKLMLKGEQPERVLVAQVRPPAKIRQRGPIDMLRTPIIGTGPDIPVDIWGIRYRATDSTNGAMIHDHSGKRVLDLDDIEHWQDYVKAPDLSNVDWESVISAQLTNATRHGMVDRSQSALMVMLNTGYFMLLVGLMGFEEALIAIGEYPEEVKAIVEYTSEFYLDIQKKVFPIYNCDLIYPGEDCASNGGPLISLKTFKEIFLPASKKHIDLAKEMGCAVSMHCCGKGEAFIDEWVKAGINIWSCVYPTNDMKALKEKYGNSLILEGGWDAPISLPQFNPTDEEIRESAKKTIDEYADGGGFIFAGFFLGSTGDMEIARKNQILVSAAEDYGDTFYK
ncbi:MAG: hypothetical protein IJ106_03485 [Parasporobacterium sp.]|nr:hypothetical protein [Parasporobacterium sp.]